MSKFLTVAEARALIDAAMKPAKGIEAVSYDVSAIGTEVMISVPVTAPQWAHDAAVQAQRAVLEARRAKIEGGTLFEGAVLINAVQGWEATMFPAITQIPNLIYRLAGVVDAEDLPPELLGQP